MARVTEVYAYGGKLSIANLVKLIAALPQSWQKRQTGTSAKRAITLGTLPKCFAQTYIEASVLHSYDLRHEKNRQNAVQQTHIRTFVQQIELRGHLLTFDKYSAAGNRKTPHRITRSRKEPDAPIRRIIPATNTERAFRYNTKSNKVRVIKTPGGELRYLHTKKKGTAPKCGDCGIKLAGVSAMKKESMMLRQSRYEEPWVRITNFCADTIRSGSRSTPSRILYHLPAQEDRPAGIWRFSLRELREGPRRAGFLDRGAEDCEEGCQGAVGEEAVSAGTCGNR